MNEDTPASEDPPDSDPAPIEFVSPGCFTVFNPAAMDTRTATWEPADCRLGETAELQRFDTPDGARAQVLALMQQARRSLCLYSPDLESWLYNHAVVQDACRTFLLKSQHHCLRILLRDSSNAVSNGHQLLTLARRLTSNLQIRKLHPDYPAEEIAFLIADDRGLLLRPEPDQYAGYALYNDPGRARLRQSQFDQAWECSTPDPNLRSFLL